MTRGRYQPDDDSQRPFQELIHPTDPDATAAIQPDSALTQSLGQELFEEMHKPSNEAGPITQEGVAEYIEGKMGEPKSALEKRIMVIVGTILILCICFIMVGIALRVLAWGLGPWIG